MITVQLNDLIFKAFHGIHKEEKILGNEYRVDVIVKIQEKGAVIEHIDETINYAVIYNIIKKRMLAPTPLLETVVMETGNDIHQEFPQLQSINISIKKMKPPIEGMQGYAQVCWEKEF